MPLEPREAPQDLASTNQWVLEIEGTRFATFTSLSGLSRQVGTMQRADGGTGRVYKFPDNQKDAGQIQLTRQRDPEDPVDDRISSFLTQSIEDGTKFSGQLTKYHRGEVDHRIRFTGMLFTSEDYPNLNKNQGGPYEITYTVQLDYWEEVGPNA